MRHRLRFRTAPAGGSFPMSAAYIMILLKFVLARSIDLQFFDGAIKTTWSCPSFDLTAPRPSRLLHAGWVWPMCMAKLVTGAAVAPARSQWLTSLSFR